MHFLNPMMLGLLFVIPPAGAALAVIAWKRKEKLLNSYGERPLVDRYSRPLEKNRYILKAVCVALASAAIIVALARPSIENGTTEFPVGSVDVIAVVDVSRSMAVQDYKGKFSEPEFSGGTRLDMARYLILNDIIASLKYNRLGVVSYAGEPNPQAFLTDDLPALKWVLRRALTISSAPGEGSALHKAFKLAFELYDLDSKSGNRKVIVLLSDGGNDDGMDKLSEIIAECKKRDIELIVAGLGKPTPSAIPVSQLSPTDRAINHGKEWYEVDGEVAMSALDENTLLLLKNGAGGRYVRVVDPSDFRIGSLISRVEVKHQKGEQELYVYPLLIALIFFGLVLFAPREPRDKSELPGAAHRQARSTDLSITPFMRRR